MIRSAEIQTKAREARVRDQQIEKDYILSWILQGTANHKDLSTKIVFKGGTVLKKVYFDDYQTFFVYHIQNSKSAIKIQSGIY